MQGRLTRYRRPMVRSMSSGGSCFRPIGSDVIISCTSQGITTMCVGPTCAEYQQNPAWSPVDSSLVRWSCTQGRRYPRSSCSTEPRTCRRCLPWLRLQVRPTAGVPSARRHRLNTIIHTQNSHTDLQTHDFFRSYSLI